VPTLRTSPLVPALAAASALAACALAACGAGHGATQPGPHPTVPASAAPRGTATLVLARTVRGLRGDEDDDDVGSPTMGTNPVGDADADADNDRLDNLHRGYYDGDDAPVRDFGRALGPVAAAAQIALARRYLQLAAASEGPGACPLLTADRARAAPRYGQAGGPAYLQGAVGCGQVMTRLFAHVHGELTGAFEVTAVRVAGQRAEVLIGSRAHPASYLPLRRQAGVWRLEQLLPVPLP
jgi:hypothetical protein